MLYLTASGKAIRTRELGLDATEWDRDVSDLGGLDVLQALLSRLSLLQRFKATIALVDAYGEAAGVSLIS